MRAGKGSDLETSSEGAELLIVPVLRTSVSCQHQDQNEESKEFQESEESKEVAECPNQWGRGTGLLCPTAPRPPCSSADSSDSLDSSNSLDSCTENPVSSVTLRVLRVSALNEVSSNLEMPVD